MSDTLFLKNKELLDVTPVENVFIAQFMPAAPELAVKAYLYGLMLLSSAGSAAEDLTKVLSCSDTDLLAAFSYWEAAGVVKVISGEPLKVQYLNIKNALIGANVDTKGAVHGDYIRKLQGVFGTRVLSGAELSKLYDWLDVFGFEDDAAVEIAKHCLDTKGARTSISYMDSVARMLAGDNLLSLDKVRERFEYEDRIRNGAMSIMRRWNRRRPLTEDELALYEKWIHGWGFDEESIDAALSKMISAEKPSFKYLDRVLDDWRSEGRVGKAVVEEREKQDDMVFELSRRAFKLAGLKAHPTAEQRLQFSDWNIDKCIGEDIILYAAELSQNDIHPYACMKRLLNDWYSKGVSTLSEAKELYEKGRSSYPTGGRKRNRALNYMQSKKYTRDDLKKLGISLGEEIYDNDER